MGHLRRGPVRVCSFGADSCSTRCHLALRPRMSQSPTDASSPLERIWTQSRARR